MDPKIREAFARQRREAPEQTLEFFRAFEPSAVGSALTSARELVAEGRVRHNVYRVLDGSYKMYRLGEAALELAATMLAPVGFRQGAADRDPNELVAELRRWGLNDVLVEVVAATTRALLAKKANEPTARAEDALQLGGGFFLVREVVLASLESMDRMARGEGFLFHEPELDGTDALFLETWAPLGLAIRSVRPEGFSDECRQLLLDKRAKAENV
ncbi:MAG TPA: hypothetical protein VF316_18950 [Polyangiaceae bacterium]